MAFTYGFFDSINGDRTYNAEQFSSIFDGLVNDGVYFGVGDKFSVNPYGSTLSVSVGTGRAWLDHVWLLNDAPHVLDFERNSIDQPRIDAVVLEVNKQNRAGYLKVVKGSDVRPTLVNDNYVHQHAIAFVTIPVGASKLEQANIKYVVGTSDANATPYVTGIVENISIAPIIDNAKAEYQAWFEEAKRIVAEGGSDLQQLASRMSAMEAVQVTFEERIASMERRFPPVYDGTII